MTRHLLPIVDSFEIALKNTENREKFVDGVNLIYTQLYSMLESQGLRPIKAVGEKFDPYKHEVLIKEGSDKPDGTVLDEMQKGYMFKDRVLRFSKVKVSEHKKQDKKIDT
jgi:molecular chaperone GrpE